MTNIDLYSRQHLAIEKYRRKHHVGRQHTQILQDGSGILDRAKQRPLAKSRGELQKVTKPRNWQEAYQLIIRLHASKRRKLPGGLSNVGMRADHQNIFARLIVGRNRDSRIGLQTNPRFGSDVGAIMTLELPLL